MNITLTAILVNLSAAIMIFVVFRYIVYPLVDAVLYAKGYMLFRYWTWMSNDKPILTAINALLTWFFNGMYVRLANRLSHSFTTKMSSEITIKGRTTLYTWKPYFHYEKIQDMHLEMFEVNNEEDDLDGNKN